MNLKRIQEELASRPAQPLNLDDTFAVLIPLMVVDGEWGILDEKRAKTLRNQPSEVSFPGGRIEEGESPREAALRETEEELGIPRDSIEVLGEMDYLLRRDGHTIRAFVGVLQETRLEDFSPNGAEVDHLFFVPLSFFQENAPLIRELSFRVQDQEDFPYELLPGGRDYPWRLGHDTLLFYEYEDHVIWGFTARMTQGFLKRVGLVANL